ncbi:patatin-like phospholipase family protein [Paracraurococcus lichenis]|uniref:Patatin-like phospholipase family protein n=1 Tax=Paracraurococcus lichenis TaxID=3064888 RepID=A0ABT9DSE3_9PROT|nr:patatin-like phospholipase family protein [Paracraurococcus sp. LOR1-02]MDO9706805.1 patatin-like phospholipase family protein [Paracraurococcus sp. LOR1-02]
MMQPTAAAMQGTRPARALVLAGGIALGAFEAGACAALEEAGGPPIGWVAGSSAGAVAAALIAGNPPGRRAARLREFWKGVAADPTPATTFWFGQPPPEGPWRQAYNQAAVMQSLLVGRPGLYRPRLMPAPRIGRVPALYDLEPLLERLRDLVDFDRLNDGSMRVTVAATDVVSGERVVFDTGRGDRIGPEHIVASCALLPLFAPIELEGRLLADGGLSSNVPLDLVLDEPGEGELECFVVELFAPAGSRPRTLAASASRAGDLAFGNQTRRILEGRVREHRLRALVAELAEHLPEAVRHDPEVAERLHEAAEGAHGAVVVMLGYRAALGEAGLGKAFDFSEATLRDRWRAGEERMREALARLAAREEPEALAPGLRVIQVD